MFRTLCLMICVSLTLVSCNSDELARFDAEVDAATQKVELMNAAETAKYAPKLNEAALADLKSARALAADQLFTQAEPKLASFHQKADAAIEHAKAEKRKAEEKAAAPVVHKVQKGDWLLKIATKSEGKFTWRELYELNRDIIKNPNKIYPGQVLTLPK